MRIFFCLVSIFAVLSLAACDYAPSGEGPDGSVGTVRNTPYPAPNS